MRVRTSMGRADIKIPFNERMVTVTIGVVPTDVPLLPRLDVLDHLKITLDTATWGLVHRSSVTRFKCIRQLGHQYLVWKIPKSVQYSIAELYKLRHHFYHPTTQPLHDLLWRASPKNFAPETLRILTEISKSCTICHTFGSRTLSFQVSMPEQEIKFNIYSP